MSAALVFLGLCAFGCFAVWVVVTEPVSPSRRSRIRGRAFLDAYYVVGSIHVQGSRGRAASEYERGRFDGVSEAMGKLRELREEEGHDA